MNFKARISKNRSASNEYSSSSSSYANQNQQIEQSGISNAEVDQLMKKLDFISWRDNTYLKSNKPSTSNGRVDFKKVDEIRQRGGELFARVQSRYAAGIYTAILFG